MMVTTQEFSALTENEKIVLWVIRELSRMERDPKSQEILISESLKIPLTGEGIKKLKTISEKNIDSDSAIELLKIKKYVLFDGRELKLTQNGIKLGKIAQIEQQSNWYNDHLLRCANSKAYALFCEKVFGKNLLQFNVLDMDQLKTLISSLNLSANDSVLDLGCGLGKITEYIQRKTGAKILGIDFAKKLIQWAKENTLQTEENKLQFQVGDMNQLNFPPTSFNAIYAIDTLYPSNIDNIDAIIGKLKNLLKPKGQLGIFFAQIIETAEQENILAPNNTKMAQALKYNHLPFTVIDFTKNARDIWEREIIVANELQEMFEQEGNLDLYKERIADGERCLFRIDNQLQKRYYYHVSID